MKDGIEEGQTDVGLAQNVLELEVAQDGAGVMDTQDVNRK